MVKILSNDILVRLFDELHNALEKLKNVSDTSEEEFLENYEKIDTAKYNFIVAIEASIDIRRYLRNQEKCRRII